MDRLSEVVGRGGAGTEVLGAARTAMAVGAGQLDDGEWFGPRGALALSAGVLTLHILTLFAFPGLRGASGAFCVVSYAAVAAAAWARELRWTGIMRMRWLLVALGTTLAAVSFLVQVVRPAGELAGAHDVFLLLSGLPLLMAIALSRREEPAIYFWLDALQGALAVALAQVALLYGSRVSGPISAIAGAERIFWADVVFALLAAVRWFGRPGEKEVRFLRVIGGFLVLRAIADGLLLLPVVFHWHAVSLLAVLTDLPALGLLVAISLPALGEVFVPLPGEEDATLGGAIGAMLAPCWMLLLSAFIVPTHLYAGIIGAGLSFLLYGARSTMLLWQAQGLQQELQRANERIQNQALSDGLTGIPNRRSFDLTLEREWKRAQRSKQPLALLMLDIDHFKDLNDQYGHICGDVCLREIGSLLRGHLGREADFAARYGGEEFAVLLMDTGLDGGKTVAESLRKAVEQYACKSPDGADLSFTVSVGVASEVPMLQESSVTLVAAADKALYRAKRNGRNRVEAHAWRTRQVGVDERP